jgi:hypothetical protein
MIMLIVNGETRNVDADPSTPLLWVLPLTMPLPTFAAAVLMRGSVKRSLLGKHSLA